MWNDGKWYFELTENFKFKTNYCLCTVVDIPFGVENYVTKNNLKLYSTYPNPTTNEVSIIYSLSNDSGGQILIDVFDLNIQTFFSIPLHNSLLLQAELNLCFPKIVLLNFLHQNALS